MKTMIYTLDTKVLENKSLYDSCYGIVPDYRKKKIDAYTGEPEKRLCLGTGILLSYAIKQAGFSESALHIAYEESGKPYFINDRNFHFSLAHSGDRAICAVSEESIGCDVEKLEDGKDLDQWTKLESYAKATDEPLSSLMNKENPFQAGWLFKEIKLDDEYKYMVCSQENLTEDNILQVTEELLKSFAYQ